MLTLTAAEAVAIEDGLDPKEIRPRRIACPICDSPEGRACVTPTGDPGPAHTQRIKAAYKTRLLRRGVGSASARWEVVDALGEVLGKVTGPTGGPYRAVFFDYRDGKRYEREVTRTTMTGAARAKVAAHARLIEELRLGIAEIQILDLSNVDGATR